MTRDVSLIRVLRTSHAFILMCFNISYLCFITLSILGTTEFVAVLLQTFALWSDNKYPPKGVDVVESTLDVIWAKFRAHQNNILVDALMQSARSEHQCTPFQTWIKTSNVKVNYVALLQFP